MSLNSKAKPADRHDVAFETGFAMFGCKFCINPKIACHLFDIR